MFTILKIAGLIFEQFGSLLLDEFFWIIVLVLIVIYRKNSEMEIRMLGSSYSLPNKISSSVLVGLAGGLTGSLLVILLGISIEDYTKAGVGSLTEAITYIWIIAVLMSAINPRYLCFSYGGGVVALMNLLFGFPKVNVPGLMALIGVLHLIESFLIWMDGYSYSVPLFLKRKDGRIIGGYSMNRVWPIPLVMFAVIYSSTAGDASLAGIIDMPGWWPLLRHSAAENSQGLTYLPLALPVVLGYGDVAITKAPEKKCRSSAARLGVYSLVLIVLALIASKLRVFAFIAAVFAPLAHELLIIYGAKEEEDGEPYFTAKEKGAKVLYVKTDSAAAKMKIEPGDTIIGVNGTAVQNESQLTELLSVYPAFIWVDVKKVGGKVVTVEYADYQTGVGNLGALIVPSDTDLYYEIGKGSSLVKKLLRRLREKNKRDMYL